MKRRRFLQTIATVPAVPVVLTQPTPAPAMPTPQSTDESPKIETTVADAAAETVPRFFTAVQLATLRKLCDILMPTVSGLPGALEAGAPEFLDFLIGQSPSDRQQAYRTGLDVLNAQARKRYNRPFAEIDASQAETLLAPLRQPWTYVAPTDPLARFLRAAKQDVWTATVNSQEWATASAASGRRTGGVGQYWYPIE
jgi:hypothetical protein